MLIEPDPLSGHASPRVDYLHTAHPPPPLHTGRTVGDHLLNCASGVHQFCFSTGAGAGAGFGAIWPACALASNRADSMAVANQATGTRG